MVGRELSQFFQRKHRPEASRVRLELRNLCYRGVPGKPSGISQPISLAIHAGEVLGIAGLVGAGRTELAEAVFGLRPVSAGQVLLDDKLVRIRTPRQAIEAGLLLVPEDRRYHGLILPESVARNISLPNLDLLSTLRLLSRTRERTLARAMCQRLHVRTPSTGKAVGLLSGGNQQKVVLAKWLARQPRVFIVDEPTRGIDVGAKSEIYALLDHLAGEGVAILMISSDLEEILGMSDRVAVLHEGRLAGILPREQLSEESIIRLATGGT
jgi:ribose transport system ATP-binding protein